MSIIGSIEVTNVTVGNKCTGYSGLVCINHFNQGSIQKIHFERNIGSGGGGGAFSPPPPVDRTLITRVLKERTRPDQALRLSYNLVQV